LLLERVQSLFDRVQPALSTDRVSLGENTGLNCVRGVVRERRRGKRQRFVTRSWKREATSRDLGNECSEHVAKPIVDHERALVEPTLHRFVVDDERRVLPIDAPALERVVTLEVVAGAGALDMLRERFPLELDLAPPLSAGTKWKVEHLDRVPRRECEE
jgi:hypothetical protein